jgi:hypothetical protein
MGKMVGDQTANQVATPLRKGEKKEKNTTSSGTVGLHA